MNFDKFLELMEELGRHEVDYVLVGGVALDLHGIVRATEDVDLFVRATEENVGRLKASLRALWADPEIDLITATDLMGDYPTLRYGPPSDDFAIDILARLGEAIHYGDLEFETVLVDGIAIRVATPRTLYRMKKDTVRPIDRADAAQLREKFALGEE